MRQALLLLIAILGAGACKRSETFHCEMDPDCDTGDRCEATGLCSSPDATCPGGHRYGESAGELANVCVISDEPDAGAVDAPDASTARPEHRNECVEGVAIPAATSACAKKVVELDASCGALRWSDRCVALAERTCDVRCSEIAVFGRDQGIRGWVPQLAAAGSVFVDADPDGDASTDPQSSGVAFADFDNDGDPDLAVTDASGWIALRNESTSTLVDFVVVGKGRFAPANGFHGYHVAWADWDNDQDLDFAVSGLGGMYLVRNTAGKFETATTSPLVPSTVKTFDWGDINGDGKLDLVVGNDGDGRIFINDSGGRFSEVPWTGEALEGIRLCDLVGDGHPDVVAGTNKILQIYVNHDGVISQTATKVADAGENFAYSKLGCGDLDGDGDLDVVIENWYDKTGMLLGFRNKGTKEGLDGTPAFRLVGGESPQGVDLGDLDGDHKLDIVVSGWDGTMFRFMNTTAAATAAITFKALEAQPSIGGYDVDLGPPLFEISALPRGVK